MNFSNKLPIGSIVKIKNVGRKMMIFGYDQHSSINPQDHYDYIGVVYPEGHIDSRLHLGFNHDHIIEVIYRGYEDQERIDFVNIMDGIKRMKE